MLSECALGYLLSGSDVSCDVLYICMLMEFWIAGTYVCN